MVSNSGRAVSFATPLCRRRSTPSWQTPTPMLRVPGSRAPVLAPITAGWQRARERGNDGSGRPHEGRDGGARDSRVGADGGGSRIGYRAGVGAGRGAGGGVCGTGAEIASGDYGWAPPGRDRLVLGHESLGRVLDPGPRNWLPGGSSRIRPGKRYSDLRRTSRWSWSLRSRERLRQAALRAIPPVSVTGAVPETRRRPGAAASARGR